MEPLEILVLGAIQGIFEWLPVSSEAAVTLFMTQLLGKTPAASVNTAIYLHAGTMLAAALYFREDFIRILEQLPDYLTEAAKDPESLNSGGLLNFLVIATFFTAALGGVIYTLGLEHIPSSPDVFSGLVGVALLVTGVLRLTGEGTGRDYRATGTWDSVFTGIIQSFSVVPGISRSGSTVFALLYRDFSSKDAFRLSFLMSVPAVLVAQVGLQVFSGFTVSRELLLATAVSFLVGYASIDAVLRIAERVEVAYIAFGLAVLSFLPLLI